MAFTVILNVQRFVIFFGPKRGSQLKRNNTNSHKIGSMFFTLQQIQSLDPFRQKPIFKILSWQAQAEFFPKQTSFSSGFIRQFTKVIAEGPRNVKIV